MKATTPEISWHSCCALYSVDFCSKTHPNIISEGRTYFMMATGSVDSMVGIWLISSNPTAGTDSIIFLSYLEKHVGSVNVVRFSPCGNLLATGGDDGNLIIWEINQSATLNVDQMGAMTSSIDMWNFKCVLRGHIDAIYDVCWSSDSTMVCSGSIDNNCILWSVEKRKYVHIFSDNKSYVQGLAWSPRPLYLRNTDATEAILCHCADGSAKMYAVSTKQVGKKISCHIDRGCLATLPDTSSIDVTNNNNNHNEIAEKAAKKASSIQIYSDDLHGSFYRRCSFSPDGLFFMLSSGVITSKFKSYLAIDNPTSKKPIHVTFLYSSLVPSTPLTYYTASISTSCISVKFSPKVYQLRTAVQNPNPYTQHLKYRMLFAVLSMDTLVIFDTQSMDPVGFVKNTHLSSHTDITWFPDGNGIVFTSTDGYCTICEFSADEIGTEANVAGVWFDKEISQGNQLVEGDSDDEVCENDLLESSMNNSQQNLPLSSHLEQDAAKFFPAEQINVHISNCCPEDIKSTSNPGIGTSNSKPRRVPFITISRPSNP